MTQEEKAKAYDEVVARINKAVSDGLVSENFGRDMLGLAESEDERIRRTLVEYFGPKVQLDLVRGVPIQKIRDWLEKQKEQKPISGNSEKPNNQWSEEDERMFNDIYESLGAAYSLKVMSAQDCHDMKKWLLEKSCIFRSCPKVSDCWKPNEEQMKALLHAEGHLRQHKCCGVAKDIAKLYDDLKKLK